LKSVILNSTLLEQALDLYVEEVADSSRRKAIISDVDVSLF